jgi:hypothetical protein
VSLPSLLSCPAEGDALIHGHIVADFRRLADDDPGSVINEDTLADFRSWVNFNVGQEAVDVRNQAGQNRHTQFPKPVGNSVEPNSVDAGVTKDNFQPTEKSRPCCWVSFRDNEDMRNEVVVERLPQLFEPTHCSHPSLSVALERTSKAEPLV